jgi:hypothetical protein
MPAGDRSPPGCPRRRDRRPHRHHTGWRREADDGVRLSYHGKIAGLRQPPDWAMNPGFPSFHEPGELMTALRHARTCRFASSRSVQPVSREHPSGARRSQACLRCGHARVCPASFQGHIWLGKGRRSMVAMAWRFGPRPPAPHSRSTPRRSERRRRTCGWRSALRCPPGEPGAGPPRPSDGA